LHSVGCDCLGGGFRFAAINAGSGDFRFAPGVSPCLLLSWAVWIDDLVLNNSDLLSATLASGSTSSVSGLFVPLISGIGKASALLGLNLVSSGSAASGPGAGNLICNDGTVAVVSPGVVASAVIFSGSLTLAPVFSHDGGGLASNLFITDDDDGVVEAIAASGIRHLLGDDTVLVLHEDVVASTESNGERTILKGSSDVIDVTTIISDVVDGIDECGSGGWVVLAGHVVVIAIVGDVGVVSGCVDTTSFGEVEEPLLPTTIVA